MKLGIDPTIDVVFKKTFGSEENKELLLSLINSVLQEGGEKQVVELQLINPYNLQNFENDKLSIVDVKAKSQTGEWFIIEIQINITQSFPKRLLYYWSKGYQEQLEKGEEYSKLNKVTLIAFCKKSLQVTSQRYWHHFKVLEAEEHTCLCDDFNVYTIELEKFLDSADDVDSTLDIWSYFLKNGKDLDINSLPKKLATPEIEKAMEVLKVFTKDEVEREIYESRLKAVRDKASLVADIKAEEKKEIAVGMLKEGLETPLICKLTKLSEAEVEELKKQL